MVCVYIHTFGRNYTIGKGNNMVSSYEIILHFTGQVVTTTWNTTCLPSDSSRPNDSTGKQNSHKKSYTSKITKIQNE